VVGAVCIHLFIGNIYLWGNIADYVMSYYHHTFQDEHATKDWSSLVLPLCLLVQTAVNPIGAYLQKKYSPKLILLIGSAVMLSGIYLCTIVKSWWGFIIIYSTTFPLGIGIVYWTPIITCWEWFPEKKGFLSGLIIGAFGLGAFFFGFITEFIANPNDDEKVKAENG
jgi:OFA family oxalate/formate antiporter-like MFS transporter